jgi:hypothetical protein
VIDELGNDPIVTVIAPLPDEPKAKLSTPNDTVIDLQQAVDAVTTPLMAVWRLEYTLAADIVKQYTEYAVEGTKFVNVRMAELLAVHTDTAWLLICCVVVGIDERVLHMTRLDEVDDSTNDTFSDNAVDIEVTTTAEIVGGNVFGTNFTLIIVNPRLTAANDVSQLETPDALLQYPEHGDTNMAPSLEASSLVQFAHTPTADELQYPTTQRKLLPSLFESEQRTLVVDAVLVEVSSALARLEISSTLEQVTVFDSRDAAVNGYPRPGTDTISICSIVLLTIATDNAFVNSLHLLHFCCAMDVNRRANVSPTTVCITPTAFRVSQS